MVLPSLLSCGWIVDVGVDGLYLMQCGWSRFVGDESCLGLMTFCGSSLWIGFSVWPDGPDGELLQLLRGSRSDGLEGRMQLWIWRA